MSWSAHVYQKIIQANPGLLVNKIKFGRRRIILIPRDLLADYVQACMAQGESTPLFEATRDWARVFCHTHVPALVRKLPPEPVVHRFLKPMWRSVGGLDDVRVTQGEDTLRVELDREALSERIGAHAFAQGSLAGVLEFLYGKKLLPAGFSQSGTWSTYFFQLTPQPMPRPKRTHKPALPVSKSRAHNTNLREALRAGVVHAGARNTLWFRDTLLMTVENSLLDVLANQDVGIAELPGIAEKYFRALLTADANERSALRLLKTLYQSFGWGIPVFELQEDQITMVVENSPAPLGAISKNGLFYLKITQGFLQALNPKYKLNAWSHSPTRLSATYAVH